MSRMWPAMRDASYTFATDESVRTNLSPNGVSRPRLCGPFRQFLQKGMKKNEFLGRIQSRGSRARPKQDAIRSYYARYHHRNECRHRTGIDWAGCTIHGSKPDQQLWQQPSLRDAE